MSATNKSKVLRDKWNSKESIFSANERQIPGLGTQRHSHSERSLEIQKHRQRDLGRKILWLNTNM